MGLRLYCRAHQLRIPRSRGLDHCRSRQGDGAQFLKLGQSCLLEWKYRCKLGQTRDPRFWKRRRGRGLVLTMAKEGRGTRWLSGNRSAINTSAFCLVDFPRILTWKESHERRNTLEDSTIDMRTDLGFLDRRIVGIAVPTSWCCATV